MEYPQYYVFKIRNRADFRAGDFEFINGSYMATKIDVNSGHAFDHFHVTSGGAGIIKTLDSLASDFAEDHMSDNFTISYELPFELFSVRGALHQAVPLDSSEREYFGNALENAIKDAYEARAVKMQADVAKPEYKTLSRR